jgi:hypothetical protein
MEPKQDGSPSLVAADPFSYEAELAPQAPLWKSRIAGTEDVKEPAPLAGLIRLDNRPQPRWPMDRLVVPEVYALSATGPVWVPLRTHAALMPDVQVMRDVQAAGVAAIPVEPRRYKGARKVEPLHTVMLPSRQVPHETSPAGGALAEAQAAIENVPRPEKLLALSRFAALENPADGARRDPWPAAPFSIVHRPNLPLPATGADKKPGGSPTLAGLRSLSIDQVPLVHGTWIDNLRALGSEGESPRYELSTPALRPRLRLAAGSRYPVATRDQNPALATIEPENLPPLARAVSIPERSFAATASSSGEDRQTPMPSAAGLMPFGVKANEPSVQTAPSAQSPNLPQPLRTEPMRPASNLEPLDGKPLGDFMNSAPTLEETQSHLGSRVDVVPPPAADAATAATAWMHIAGFWKHAPRDLKLLVFGIPILLALALHPSLKKIPYTAPQEAGETQRKIERNFQTKLKDQWLNVRQSMVNRAAIALDEDFRAGLDDWTSRGGTTEWTFDATGFVRPGPLALYRPSVELTDYQLQFLGMIDKKALSWVVRAADFDDYYVVKLVVLKPGPVPTIGVTRYAVIHGVAQDRSDTTAFINAREDMLYRVRMDIHSDTFTLTVQGQMVDSWTEPRLRKGGIGFFTARGEASRLRWVQVTHQYDMLGRLCAYLAPYNIPSTNGGWQP